MSNMLGALIAVRPALAPLAAASGAQTPIVIDALATGNAQWDDGVLVLQSGAVSGTPDDTTVDVKIQHSDDGLVWADAADDAGNAYAKTGILHGAGKSAVLRFDRQILKRYLQAVLTVNFTGGTDPKVQLASLFIFGNAHQLPTA